jgi:glycosyltransferase involved in cell wall biosynthesis
MEELGLMPSIELSIITPCFNEEDTVSDCALSLKEFMLRRLPTVTYEHIFVDNSSSDETVTVIKRLANEDNRIKLLINSRNVGPQASIFNAFRYVSGRAIIPMLAADQQDPVEVIQDFYKNWKQGFYVVFGIRKNRQENYFLKTLRTVFYLLIQKFAYYTIPVNAGEFMLVDRRVIDSLMKTNDHNPYLRGMIANAGVKSTFVNYDMKARTKGNSKTSIIIALDVAVNAFISTSRISARLILLSGFTIASIGIIIGLVSLIPNQQILELSFEITALLVIGGLQMFFTGIMGEYVISIHGQVRKDAPHFLVETVNI